MLALDDRGDEPSGGGRARRIRCIDLDLDDVAGNDDGGPGGGAGQDHIALLEREVLREVGDDLGQGEEESGGRVVLSELAVDPGAHAQRARVDEPGVDPARQTETLAQARFEVNTQRWAGVPFILRSGKAVGHPRTEIVVRFRPVSHLPTGFTGDAPGAVLRFSLGPDRVSLELYVNGGADPFRLERDALEADLGEGTLLAYSEVLDGLLTGDAALSVRGDAAVQCWRIVEPIVAAWKDGSVPLDDYPAGSGGPSGWPDLGD